VTASLCQILFIRLRRLITSKRLAKANEANYAGKRKILRGFSSKIFFFSSALTPMFSTDWMVS
jgi:hypothetical protein